VTGDNTAPSWQDVVQEHGLVVRGSCLVCRLDPEVLEQLHAGYAAGHRGKFYGTYMHAIGRDDITATNVHNHFERLHHEKRTP